MADREAARAGIRDGANSNRLGHPADRRRPARISGASLLRFLAQVREPRIFRLGGFGLVEIELGAVGQSDSGQRLTGLLGLLDHRADAWSARLAQLARLALAGCWSFGLCRRARLSGEVFLTASSGVFLGKLILADPVVPRGKLDRKSVV